MHMFATSKAFLRGFQGVAKVFWCVCSC